ncbi:hypothetical protein CCAL12920_02740 [Campylobacter sp. RM12920]|uniref:Oxidoreductase n=1 Tax=Campylobacter californiensis TaxID=1032243 RepID=A0ABD4JIP4_9BACT|nr:hypothetical protein [Campylobacter sp. RM12919]MBE2987816.1 hypothetical protein [Campylobacter sp. RM12920]
MRVGEIYGVLAIALANHFNKILDVTQFMQIKKSKTWLVQNDTQASRAGSALYSEFLQNESSAALCDDFVILEPYFKARYYFNAADEDLAKFYKSINFTPKMGEVDSISNQLVFIAAVLKNELNENSEKILKAFLTGFFLPYATVLSQDIKAKAQSKFYGAMGYFLEDFCKNLQDIFGIKQRA